MRELEKKLWFTYFQSHPARPILSLQLLRKYCRKHNKVKSRKDFLPISRRWQILPPFPSWQSQIDSNKCHPLPIFNLPVRRPFGSMTQTPAVSHSRSPSLPPISTLLAIKVTHWRKSTHPTNLSDRFSILLLMVQERIGYPRWEKEGCFLLSPLEHWQKNMLLMEEWSDHPEDATISLWIE